MVLVMTVLALSVSAVAYRHGVAREGLIAALKLLGSVGPILIPAFMLAGMAAVLVSPESLARWLGQDTGARGLLLGTAAGALTPGGPFVAFPLLAVLLKSGASVGVVTAYVTSWALLGVHRLAAFELPILGWRFALCRFAASLLFPVVIGWLAQLLWGWIGRG
jgi:uncharacterized membrane protein YraQ (UPF0718 family)